MLDRRLVKKGNNNIQALGNVYIENYFSDYHPTRIVFYEVDLCNIIEEFDKYTDFYDNSDIETSSDDEFKYLLKPEKNILNKLSDESFDIILEDFLPYFNKVKTFLELPQNKELLKKYKKSVVQLKVHITIKSGVLPVK